MRTISLKIPESLERELDGLANRRHTTKSAILREAVGSLAKSKRRSAADRAGELVGSLRGPVDLSTSAAHMRGYGE